MPLWTGAPAPDDHPAYVLQQMHRMRVPLEEDAMTEEEHHVQVI
jgi:hypothetical protein